MTVPRDPNETIDPDAKASTGEPANATVDLSDLAADALEVGLAAAFGKHSGPPRSNLGAMRPVLLKEAEGESALVVRPASDAMPTKDEAGDRYQLSGEIARGGMGAVLRGRDVDLGRDLAVKVLLEKYANRPDVARRFIEEAQIGGQLQHPGVVPIYDIGRFGDRPFFTMKLVKGQTLAAILSERTDPATDRPRLLNIALQVSQAMAYAHAKGVIHRDLKPANIMVGAFGEVQVMDWGLAKVLAQGGVADEERASRAHQERDDVTRIQTARSTGSSGSFGTDTEAGSILGTPAYMPPEQASGDIAHLDRRADVFALGALLCEILTGKPPYLGRSAEEVRRKAANGDLKDAVERLEACGADAELVSLTRKCLSPEAIDRPKDAQEVTDGLTAYLNGVQERVQEAERERAVAVVREAEQRKKRKVQLALATAVVGLMLGGGAFAFWRAEQAQAGREREARNAEAVAALLRQAEDALKADDAARAAVTLEAARKRSAESGAEQEQGRLKRLDADLALLRDLDVVDQFRWTVGENKLPDPAVVATRTRDALRRFGADPDAASVDEAAARVMASVARDRIVSALDRLLTPSRLIDPTMLNPQVRAEVAAPLPKTTGVRELLRRVDADPSYRDAVRDAVIAGDRAKFVGLAGQEAAMEQPPGFVAFLGGSAAIGVERRRQLLQTAVSQRPGDLGLLMTLGNSYPNNQEDGANERLRWFQAAVAVAPANAATHDNLGIALCDKGQVDEAIACYRKAIELDPKHAGAHSNLGAALIYKGQMDEAIACCRKAIELDPKFAKAHNNLGVALKKNGQVDEAIACCRKAIELDPKSALAHTNLGAALREKSLVDEALACHRKAVELDPKYALAYNNLAFGLMETGDLVGARNGIDESLRLDPRDALARATRAEVLLVSGRFADAVPALEWAVERLIQTKPGMAPTYAGLLPGVRRLAEQVAMLHAPPKPESAAAEPTALELAERARAQHRPALAARIAEVVFVVSPTRANDLSKGYRYQAARNASLTAAGQGEDETKLDDAERARLRNQALAWLRADLALLSKQLDASTPTNRAAAQQALSQWQKDPDLAAIRDPAALAKLPAEEQKACTQLWADVASILKRAETSTAQKEQK